MLQMTLTMTQGGFGYVEAAYGVEAAVQAQFNDNCNFYHVNKPLDVQCVLFVCKQFKPAKRSRRRLPKTITGSGNGSSRIPRWWCVHLNISPQ